MAIQLPRDLDARVQAAVRHFWDMRSTQVRNSIGVDIDPEYCRMALRRLDSESGPLFAQASIEYRTAADLLSPATIPAVADAPQRKLVRRRRTRRGLDGDARNG